MDVEVPVFVKDPTIRLQAVRRIERFRIRGERVFLDGPVSDRVAVLDFDPKDGELKRGARWVPGRGPKGTGCYSFGKYDGRSNDWRFIATAVFGGVMRTIAMFEEPETLGRRVDWAFDGPQLLVVPRAGDWANAFYDRDSRSLQFFFFEPEDGSSRVYTCKSQDIIAHETTHALIDAVAPDLYDAVSPQSQAIHEGVADLATLLSALRSRELAASVLAHTRGNLRRPSAFPTVAEQFGQELDGRRHGLRSLINPRKLTDRDLDRTEPHALSEVFSGALYDVFVRMFEALRAKRGDIEAAFGTGFASPAESGARASPRRSRARKDTRGFALWLAGRVFQRFVLRALDFLPPGEISFADYGRAMWAADRASYPRTSRPRAWLQRAFVARRILARGSELETPVRYAEPRLDARALEELSTSDFAAYRFAERHRRLLGLRASVPFEVRKRQVVEKREWHATGPKSVKQLLFKVSWTEREACQLGGEFPRWRQLHVGTTLVFDWESGRVCTRLTTGGARKREDERTDRDGVLQRLRASGDLLIGEEVDGVDGRPVPGAVHGHRVEDALRVRGMARMLHVTEVS